MSFLLSVPVAGVRVDGGGAVGEGGGLAAVGDAELGQDVGDVDAGGFLGDEQGAGDLPVGVALGEVLQDVPFP